MVCPIVDCCCCCCIDSCSTCAVAAGSTVHPACQNPHPARMCRLDDDPLVGSWSVWVLGGVRLLFDVQPVPVPVPSISKTTRMKREYCWPHLVCRCLLTSVLAIRIRFELHRFHIRSLPIDGCWPTTFAAAWLQPPTGAKRPERNSFSCEPI